MKKFNLWFVLTCVFFATAPSAFAKNISGSISDLVKSKQAYKCTYVTKVDKQQNLNGVIYTANKKFRMEIAIPYGQNKKIKTYALSDGKDMYMWNSSIKTGTKFNIKEMEKLAKETSTDTKNQSQANTDLKKKYQFKCTGWKSNASFFRIPTNISFMDLGKTVQKFEGVGKNMKENTCAVCGRLPESVREQCLNNCK